MTDPKRMAAERFAVWMSRLLSGLTIGDGERELCAALQAERAYSAKLEAELADWKHRLVIEPLQEQARLQDSLDTTVRELNEKEAEFAQFREAAGAEHDDQEACIAELQAENELLRKRLSESSPWRGVFNWSLAAPTEKA